MTTETTDREEIRSALQAINAAWRERRYAEIPPRLHERAVFVAPGFEMRVEGRAACADSYRAFAESAVIRDWREHEPVIELWRDTAIASYRYEIAWDHEGKSYRETGHDLFVFTREEGQWRAVWRTMVLSAGA
jgi:hypothetical protein